MAGLERVTLAIDSDLLARFDRLLGECGLGNRSEAVRDLIRARLVEEERVAGRGEAVASLTLLYDHEQRELAERLVEAGHHHPGARVLATLHVHLDERLCLELLALRGTPAGLRRFADALLGLKGVLHGQLVVSSPAVATSRRARRGAAREEDGGPAGHVHPHPHPHQDGTARRRRPRRRPGPGDEP
ncbi:MAG: nickel-responsive transcriptional regulator NikR [Thermoanaerobaculia bacterium]|nr:nickel-responsive transcriptional regulator NikR [Thermoanaerobaculia bacterium]